MWGALALLLSANAEALYERAVRLPTYAPWRDPLAEAAERFSLLRRAAKASPGNALYRMALCEILPAGDPGRREILERLARSPDPAVRRWALWSLASDALLKGNVRRALALLERAPPDPGSALLDMEEAFCLVRLGRPEGALERLRDAAGKERLEVYKSPARLDMERAHPHFCGTPLGVLALSSRLRETCLSVLSWAEGRGPDKVGEAARAALRLSLLLAKSEGIPAAPEAASQIAAEALEALARTTEKPEAKAELERKALEVRGAVANAKSVPKPRWADELLALFTFGVGRGKTALLTRWLAWLLVPALSSLILGLLLSWPLGLVAKRGRPRRLARTFIAIATLVAGTAVGIKAAWNPLLQWAERKIARYEREWRQAKAGAVSASVEKALKGLNLEGGARK